MDQECSLYDDGSENHQSLHDDGSKPQPEPTCRDRGMHDGGPRVHGAMSRPSMWTIHHFDSFGLFLFAGLFGNVDGNRPPPNACFQAGKAGKAMEAKAV